MNHYETRVEISNGHAIGEFT